ncbi:transporter, betaine/carnitine/choline transporter (BCCT) family [compost metagenome]
MGMLCARGDLDPPRWLVVLWGTLTSAAASVLLVMGGLVALQTAAIIFAAPFLAVMLGLCVSLWKALLADRPVGAARDSLTVLRDSTRAIAD